jgi:hypothetical protein
MTIRNFPSVLVDSIRILMPNRSPSPRKTTTFNLISLE